MTKSDWRNLDYTQELLKELRDQVAGYIEGWMGNAFVGPTADETSQVNANALGNVNAFRAVINYIEEVPQEEENDD